MKHFSVRAIPKSNFHFKVDFSKVCFGIVPNSKCVSERKYSAEGIVFQSKFILWPICPILCFLLKHRYWASSTNKASDNKNAEPLPRGVTLHRQLMRPCSVPHPVSRRSNPGNTTKILHASKSRLKRKVQVTFMRINSLCQHCVTWCSSVCPVFTRLIRYTRILVCSKRWGGIGQLLSNGRAMPSFISLSGSFGAVARAQT